MPVVFAYDLTVAEHTDWKWHILMSMAYDYIFEKRDESAFEVLTKHAEGEAEPIVDDFTDVCIFRAKKWLLFKSFKCDLTLE
jgi:hypothetical protein